MMPLDGARIVRKSAWRKHCEPSASCRPALLERLAAGLDKGPGPKAPRRYSFPAGANDGGICPASIYGEALKVKSNRFALENSPHGIQLLTAFPSSATFRM